MLSKWYEVQVQGTVRSPAGPPVSKVRLRFDLPDTKSLDPSMSRSGILAIFSRDVFSDTLISEPWILMVFENTKGIAEMLAEQRLHLKEKQNGELVAAEVKKSRSGRFCWMGIKRKEGHTDWSLTKLSNGLLCALACKTYGSPPPDFRRFARQLLDTVEIKVMPKPKTAPQQSPLVDYIIDPKAGIGIKMPAGWERQDLLGVCIVYAPGQGFRSRITYPFHSGTGKPKKIASLIKDHLTELRPMFVRFRIGKLLTSAAGKQRFSHLRYSGILKRNRVKIQGMIVIVPAGKYPASLNFLAQAGDEFRRFLPAFLETAKSVKTV